MFGMLTELGDPNSSTDWLSLKRAATHPTNTLPLDLYLISFVSLYSAAIFTTAKHTAPPSKMKNRWPCIHYKRKTAWHTILMISHCSISLPDQTIMAAFRFKKDKQSVHSFNRCKYSHKQNKKWIFFCRMLKQNRAHESQLVFSACLLKAYGE